MSQQQVINVGNIPNDGSGDPIRVAFQKTNDNFTELFNIGGVSGIANGTSNIQIALNSTVGVSAAGVSNVLVVSGTGATVQGTLLANATITATGNVEAGGFFLGDGSQLTGVVSSPVASLITGNTLSPNVVNSTLQTVGVLTSLSVSGTVSGGNLATSGTIVASGNINGLNLNTAGVASVAGNIIGGNLNTGGGISAVGAIDTAGNVTASFFIGDGSLLSGISAGTGDASQLTGTTLSPNVVNSTLQTVGNLNNLIVSNALGGTGNVTSNNISAAASIVAAGDITGGNITSLGSANVVTLNVIGTATAGNISAPSGNVEANNIQFTGVASGTAVSVTGNISGAAIAATGNISTTANISATNLFGTIVTPTQNLITAVGILSSLSVAGNVTSGNISTSNVAASGTITAAAISTGGALQSASLSASGNIQGGNVSTTGQVSATGNISGNSLSLSGAATVGGNISGADLTLSGTAIVGGNLIVNGNTVYTNIDDLAIQDPIITIGRGPNNTPLITNDGKDRGEAMYYFDTAERIGFIGYQLSTGKLIAARVVNINNEQVTVSQYGTMRVGTLESDAVSATGNVQAGNVSATNVIQTASLTATGNIVGGNTAISGAAAVNSLTASTTVSAAGTVTGGNIATAGTVSAGGNLSALNITSSNSMSTTSLTVSGNTATVTTASYAIGYRDIPQNTTFGTLATTDGGKHYYGSGTLTLPTNGAVPLAVGTTILVVASGATTISPAAGVTLRQAGTANTGSRSLAANGMATIIKVETNLWYINGTGLT
jgi:hypothetical protein